MKLYLRRIFGLQHTKQRVDLDVPETTHLHGKIIQAKPWLKKIYLEHYQFFKKNSQNLPDGKKIELGSGGGFLKEAIPDVITSDVLLLANIDQVFSALALPFAADSLSAIYMIDVMHHLPDVEKFFQEADRCLLVGGKIILVEPANTWWGRFIYKNFHHEPFEPTIQDWKLPAGGPMSVANDALPWIVLIRDRAKFQTSFPQFDIISIQFCHPLRYLLSGGVSMRQLLPTAFYPAVRWLEETILAPFAPNLGMFMRVVIQKR